MRANLVGDVRPGLADVAVHLAHDADVLVGVQQRVLLLAAVRGTSGSSAAAAAAVRGAVGLEAGVGEDDDEALAVLVLGGDGDVLLCDELGQFGRRAGLGS